MKNPIVRLTIAQNITISGTAVTDDGEYINIHQRFESEDRAFDAINEARDLLGYEFQLIVQRAHHDKRAA